MAIRAFAELRSYTDPPSVVQQTVQALVLTLYPQACKWEQWTTCKQVPAESCPHADFVSDDDEPVHVCVRVVCVCVCVYVCVVYYTGIAKGVGEFLSQLTGATPLP